ncbi:unnamed protein product [Candida verbasci]|uniref:L-2-hydroxyglutarate dehydrogenase, mitochondrial n=1 Tax=Candida verbasci TaxID=1227364 RepID=A0A9W4X9Q9_9ASCO|nr:unnamed protein product [Candida verbasci]
MFLSRIRQFHASTIKFSDFTHVIIGGGIVGTAIAAELQQQPDCQVLLIEKNDNLGIETTSRNSEVIHAGLYYPPNSLKAKLCIAGKNKIYDAHRRGNFQVNLRNCGKWIVAQQDEEVEYLNKLANNAKELNVPVEFISTTKAKDKYPLIRAEKGILESPSTGIISAHDYLMFHEGGFENNEGTIALNSKVINIDYHSGIPEYKLTVSTENGEIEITSDNIINSAGLYAPEISNILLPKDRHYKSYFAKGNYFSYTAEKPLGKITDTLIYPCPNPNASSLGTHLTFDLGGQLRFGPDLEWLDIEKADDIDYTPNPKNLTNAFEAVKTYFPAITQSSLNPSYSGVRPKLISSTQSKLQFSDFIIKQEDGFPGFVNLLGIESPGLTASWAIAEYVKNIYY